MSAPPESKAEDSPAGYIRGGGVGQVSGRRMARIVIVLIGLILASLAVAFTVSAVDHNSRAGQLRKHGVPVSVLVTGCVGNASGTGITYAGFNCRGAFTLNGRSHNAAIGGTEDQLVVGQRIAAVTVPSNTSILYTAASASTMRQSFSVYVTPLALLASLIVAVLLWVRLRPRDAPAKADL